MAIAGWHLVRLVEEARRDLVGSTLEGTWFDQASGSLALPLGSRQGKRWLVVNVRGTTAAFHWSADKAEVGLERFTASERFNRLWRATLIGIDLPMPDRLIHCRFEREEGEINKTFDLYLGWAGNSGNVWLVNPADGVVLETLWESRFNPPKSQYVLPKPPSLIDWRGWTLPEYVQARGEKPDLPLIEFLTKRVWGIDAALAEHLASAVSRIEVDAGSPRGRWLEFSALIRELRRAIDSSAPVVMRPGRDGTPTFFPAGSAENGPVFHSLSSAMSQAHSAFGTEARRSGILALVRGAAEKKIQSLRKRLSELDRAIEGEAEAVTLKRHADLLGAQRDKIKRGAKTAVIEDWETGEAVTLSLDPALSPQENIEAIYKRTRKLANAAQHARGEQPSVAGELARAEALRRELTGGELTEERVAEIAAELDAPVVPSRSARVPQARRLPYREFQMGKYTVLVGRSSRDNDELTRRIARPGDLFFHADQVGGSHVILRRAGKAEEFPAEAIVAAAQIAAFFSKARHSTLVPVIYADVRHVSKPRKAPAGLVRVSNEKSVMARPLAPPGYHE